MQNGGAPHDDVTNDVITDADAAKIFIDLVQLFEASKSDSHLMLSEPHLTEQRRVNCHSVVNIHGLKPFAKLNMFILLCLLW